VTEGGEFSLGTAVSVDSERVTTLIGGESMRNLNLVFVLGMTLSCAGKTPSGTTQSGSAGTSTEPPRVCLGISERVAKTCGCTPWESPLITAITSLNLAQNVQQKLEQCVDGKIHLKVYTYEIVEGALEGCSRKEVKLDEEITKSIIGSFHDMVSQIPQNTKDAWTHCYERNTSG
jgi:hypothetical protein